MQELESRVSKVEWTLEHHAEALDALQDSTEDFRKSLHAIEATLSQIKWFAMGASALYFADSLGITQAFKLLGL
jgi:chlorite dismutase